MNASCKEIFSLIIHRKEKADKTKKLSPFQKPAQQLNPHSFLRLKNQSRNTAVSAFLIQRILAIQVPYFFFVLSDSTVG